jgi:hypothetical protein
MTPPSAQTQKVLNRPPSVQYVVCPASAVPAVLPGLSYSNADAKRCGSVLLSATQRIRAVISERGAAIC